MSPVLIAYRAGYHAAEIARLMNKTVPEVVFELRKAMVKERVRSQNQIARLRRDHEG